MSDSRFHLKISFSIYGKDYEWDSSLNWSASPGEIDQRIADWFIACHADAYADFLDSTMEYERAREAKELEQQERNELARLQQKYGKGDGNG